MRIADSRKNRGVPMNFWRSLTVIPHVVWLPSIQAAVIVHTEEWAIRLAGDLRKPSLFYKYPFDLMERV
jgi:hypothetical protein